MKSKSKDKIIIVAGDFNLPHINWESMAVKAGCNQSNQHHYLLDMMDEHGMEQIQTKVTRQDHNLDLYFTSHPSLVKSSDTVPGISDHDMVVIDSYIKPKYNKPKKRKIFLYKKADWDSIHAKMEELAEEVCKLVNVEDSWKKLKVGIHGILDSKVPSKQTSSRHNQPWITSRLQRKIRKKHQLHQTAKKTNTTEDWEKYRMHKRAVQKEVRNAHWTYVNEILTNSLEEGSNKSFWKYIKAKRSDNVGVAGLKHGGILHQESKAKAEILNNQFRSVFTKDDSEEQVSPLKEPPYPEIDELNITPEGVGKLLNNINVSKSSGPDNIPNRILKLCSRELAPAVAHLFNLSFQTGQLPSDWKNAKISPIFKKGNRHEASNYRPVSLTSVLCKTLEHIICSHVRSHLDRHNILTPLQHGFRKRHSCESQLAITMNDITQMYDRKKQVDLVILDFSKAFDTVPHRKLLCKLENYGIRGNTLKWITSFLTDRQQWVVVEGEESSKCTVDSGVPQGTVLGPLLFLCHINDIVHMVSSQARLFADDCLLYRQINSHEDHLALQRDLDELQHWADAWGMKFNTTKCYLMSIHRGKKSSYYYQLNNQFLKLVQDNPYLGVQISSDLKWTTHINKVCAKSNSTLGFIRRNLKHSGKNLKEQAYISLVRPVLEYASIVWDPHTQKDIDRIEGVQRRAARFVCNDYSRHSSISQMMTELRWTPLKERRRDQRLTFFHRIVHDLVAIPSDIMHINSRKQRTSHSKCIKMVACKTDTYKYSFIPRTIPEWNSLPESAVLCETSDAFKTVLRGNTPLSD